MKISQQQLEALQLCAQLLQIGNFSLNGADLPKVVQAMQQLQVVIGEAAKALEAEEVSKK